MPGASVLRCVYCGAVGVVRRRGGALVMEPTLLGEASGKAAQVGGVLAVPLATALGAALPVVAVAAATRPGMGHPIAMGVAALFAGGVLRRAANPLAGALVALAVGLTLALKPWLVPHRSDLNHVFSPTSETSLNWVIPGVIVTAAGLLFVGTLTRARLVHAARTLAPRRLPTLLALAAGVGLGAWQVPEILRETPFERLTRVAPALDALDTRLATAAQAHSATPLSPEALAELRADRAHVDLFLRAELGPSPDAKWRYASPSRVSPVLWMRRDQRGPKHVYSHHPGLHEPMNAFIEAEFTWATQLQRALVVDAPGAGGSALGTLVDLESGAALGTVTGPAAETPRTAADRLREQLWPDDR